ncbi:MAG: hypothetical protein Q8Q13_03665, partial [bacterium]|nr:hypothetical protein [bacterium]
GELSSKSKEEAQEHQVDFLRNFQSRLEVIASDVEELKRSVEKPDFQYMAKKSLIAAGRMESGEKRKLLASLLGDRLNTKTDFGEIVYNEALETVAKLTDRQIKMLALQCDIGSVSQKNIPTWDQYNAGKKTLLAHVLPLNFQQSDLQHISYSGCGSVSPFETGLVQTIKAKYGNLFLKPIAPDEPLFAEIKASAVFGLFYEKNGNLRFGASKVWFEEIIRQSKGIDTALVGKIIPLYDTKGMNEDEALETIKTECFMGPELIDAWNTKQLKHLSLTSVGMIIGVSVIEEVTQLRIGKDDWLGLTTVKANS